MKKIFILFLFALNVAMGQSITISPNNPEHIKVVKTGTARIDLEGKGVEGMHSGNSQLNLYSKGTYKFISMASVNDDGKASINFLNTGNSTPIFTINNNHQDFYSSSNNLKISAGTNDHMYFFTDGSIRFPTTEVSFTEDKRVVFGPLNSTDYNANFVVNSKVGNTHAVFGNNSAGVSIESNPPGIGLNEYYNEARKPIANGYVGGINLDPNDGTFKIYNSATSGTSNISISTFDRLIINKMGNIGIGISPTAQLDVVRGTAPDGTAIFRGTTHVSHFNHSTDEHTYIRGGKNGSNVIINDAGLGNVIIGTGTATEKLHVFGNIKASGSVCASNISCPSDIRFKKNIVSINNPLDNLLKINGVRYDLRKDEFPEKNFSDKNQIGFIAQDLEKIFPEMVFTDTQGYKSVDYARLTPVLVEALKELTLKNQTLESRLDKIEAMLTTTQPNTENSNSKK